MRVSVVDKLDILDRRVTGEGYLAVRANAARSGVYQYTRREIGMTDGDPNELVGVYRSPEYTFNEKSMATFAHRPMTLNHPAKDVSPKSWRKDAIGHIGGTVQQAEDRKHLVIDMLLMDEDGIAAANSTHKQISAGYSTDIEFRDGISPEGEPYVAEMVGEYRVNHAALVPLGRAGHTCRVGDAAWPTEIEDTVPPKKEAPKMKIVYDGLTVDLSDEGAATAFAKKLTDAKDAAEKAAADATKALTDAQAATATAATEHATAIQAKDAEVTTLTTQVATLTAQLADASSPERLKAAAAAYAKVVDQAKALGATVTDGATEAEIVKTTVDAKLGDAAKGWTPEQYAVSFNTLAASVPVTDALRQSHALPTTVRNLGDGIQVSRNARQEMIDAMNTTADAA